jgi:tetratricopeptide (TPR) repeat protein
MTYRTHPFPKRLWWSLVLCATLGCTPVYVFGQSNSANPNGVAIKALIEQARFWEKKGRGDLAAAAWKRLLQIDPQNPDALAGLAQIELDNNRLDAAKTLTDQLKKQPQVSPEVIKKIEGTSAMKSVNTRLLEQARQAARAGRSDEAVGLYRQLFDNKPPAGPLALEFFQTLGGTSTGWDDARKGLEGLVASEPSNSNYALAYAQHLTYRAATRREGIRLLSQLSRNAQVSRGALDAWRKALIWLEAGKSDTSLFHAYLELQPNDTAVRAKLSGVMQAFTPRATPPDPKTIALKEGFNALNDGDLGDAEKRFEGLLVIGPKNPDALGGLGVVRLKQERFVEAEKLLAEAIRISGNQKWREALTSASFWKAIEQGDAAVKAGDLNAARGFYERAARIDPKNVRGLAAQADLLVEEGRLADAERFYRDILAVHPKSVDVMRGLAGVLVRQGKVDEALALANNLTEAEREDLGYGSLRAEQYRRRAVQLMAKGDPIAAMQHLEEALLWDPNSPWLRLELARLYHRSGANSEAFGLMDGLLQTHPDMPDALHAAALMAEEAKEWSLGLSMLEKIPSKARTREMSDLQRKLWVRAQTARAESLAKLGHKAQALQAIEQAQAAAGRDADMLAGVAQVLLEIGDASRSLVMLRTLLAQTPKPDPGLLVQYAALLLRSRQDVELATQLRQIYTYTLTAEQRKNVDSIRWAYSIRQADAQREASNFAASYEILAQLLSEKPTDVTAQQALARLYTSAGDPAKALAWYHHILQQTDPDAPTLVAAGGAALAAGDLKYAEAALTAAARMAPSDPSVLTSLGRLARAQGKNRQAIDLLQQAQQVTTAQARLAQTAPLAVNFVDYAVATPQTTPHPAGVTSAIPPIPNPIGLRPVGPALNPPVRPLMQPVTRPQVGNNLPVGPVSEFVPLNQTAPAAQQYSNAASVYTDTPPPSSTALKGVSSNPYEAVMRPVQYQPPTPYQGLPSAEQRYETQALPSYSAPGALPPYPAAYGTNGTNSAGSAHPIAPASTTSVFASPVTATQEGPYLMPVERQPLAATANHVNAGSVWLQAPASNGYTATSTTGESSFGTSTGTSFGTGSRYSASSNVFTAVPEVTPPEPPAPKQWGDPSPPTASTSSTTGTPAPLSRRYTAQNALQREIDEMRADRSGSIGGGGSWRGRSGNSGTSELTDFSTVIEGRFPVTEGGHLVLRFEPVFLGAGRVSTSDLNASQQFGSNALANVGGQLGTTREQQDSGVALSVAYETSKLKLDFGFSPLGFRVQNIVGGVTYNDSIGDVKVKLDLSRRPVNDSLLSYAGTVDDVTGKTWGGVTATGGRLELSVEEGRFGFYGYGGFHWLNGKNVVSNNRFEIGGGAYYKLIQDTDMELTAGLGVTALGYRRNLRYFTLGHGGYFSPQRYFSIDLPIEFSGRSGRLAYRLDGSIGIQSFRENSTAYFPGDATQQANWEAVATANTTTAPSGVSWRTYYPGQSKTGLGFRLGGAAEYRFSPQWAVGGRIAIDNAADYTQTSGLVYVKYFFEPFYTQTKFPPKTMKVGM